MLKLEYHIPELINFIHQYKIISSAILVLVGLFIKKMIVKRVRKVSQFKGEDKRHQISTLKNIINISLLLLLFLLWSTELQQFALSITAFVVAFVFATREFIQCLLGFIYVLSARPFRIGDWVQVGDVVGEVVGVDWIKTTLLEVDASTYEYTGRHIYIPNNKLIINTVVNLNFMRRYAVHTFTIITDPDVNVYELKPRLEKLAHDHCQHFSDVAERYKSVIEKRLDIGLNVIEPSIRITTNEYAKCQTEITIFCPAEEAIKIEQQISSDFMEYWHKIRERKGLKAS
ncbi:mechanosensitive ion channel family protein [Paraneptunicella aestuarii]|uniref:mechanosensitive ion channel family protein n=1 Tax=Paraneptunicella aestuarii TaxID=2831148 RepID=UPI001E4F9356|nr:mechanosensitive ion channel family protein [Paraneptunicella aestuarii]UAA40383.1 mechanosensitive ion channel family protein [Paraneptunicella aestuarii]